jgi:hypothetical protein
MRWGICYRVYVGVYKIGCMRSRGIYVGFCKEAQKMENMVYGVILVLLECPNS